MNDNPLPVLMIPATEEALYKMIPEDIGCLEMWEPNRGMLVPLREISAGMYLSHDNKIRYIKYGDVEIVDRWCLPLSKKTIERRKEEFVKSKKSLADCTCMDCGAQKNNRCVLQWDLYNTDGDCLAEK